VQYEEDHATMRALDMAQAFLLQQYMGIFSGIPRKIGLAESCFMIVPTIILQARRLLLLDPEPYFATVLETDCPEKLDSVWRRWCEQESMRRLIYHSFVLDSQTSITRNTNPTLSYASMETPLPAPEQIWHAETAVAWKDEVLKLSAPTPPPSLKELIQDPRLLGTCKDRVEIPFMQSIYLSGMWSIVREYRQLSSIATGSSTWNTSHLTSRHAELQSVMQQFPLNSCGAAATGPLTPEIALLFNLVSMHLHVSFNELQPPSVEDSLQEELKTAVYAESWIQGDESRRAIWHAGQIIGAAQSMDRETLCDAYSIAFLQATIVLLVAGNFSRCHPQSTAILTGSTTSVPAPELRDVSLNTPQTPELDLYLAYGDGNPGLSADADIFIPLHDCKAIVEVLKRVIEENWQPALPPSGTDEVIRVLDDLCAVSVFPTY
jgi:hypothetical protein